MTTADLYKFFTRLKETPLDYENAYYLGDRRAALLSRSPRLSTLREELTRGQPPPRLFIFRTGDYILRGMIVSGRDLFIYFGDSLILKFEEDESADLIALVTRLDVEDYVPVDFDIDFTHVGNPEHLEHEPEDVLEGYLNVTPRQGPTRPRIDPMADITLDSDTSSESELDLEDMLVESDDFSDDTLQALRGDPHWYTNAPASSSIDAESENVIESETISAFNRVDTYEPRPIDWPRRAREVPRRVLELPDDPETIGELEDALVEARESLEAMSSLRGHTISFMVEIAQLLGARRISIRPIMQIGSHVHRNIELALSGLEFDYTDLGFESPVNTMAHSQLLQLLATPLRILWPQVRRKWRSAIFDAEQHLVDVPVNALAAINEMAETSEINLRVFFAVLIHNYYWKIAKAYCYIFAAVWRESFGAAIGFFERQLA